MKLLEYVLRGTPGHPIHPPLTDATIGAYTFATIAAVLSKLGVAEEGFAHGWWLALVVGLVISAATALTGRLSDSNTSIEICTLLGSSAPRQRRGRNGLIGVTARSGALIGRIGPCADRL